MLVQQLVTTSRAVAATRSRSAKTEALAAAVADLADDELDAGLALLAGHPRQDRLEVGWAGVRDVDAAPADTATLTVGEVDTTFEALVDAGGEGAQARRAGLLTDLFGRATADEQDWLRAVLLRDVRQGASDQLVLSAVAAACDVPLRAVQRAVFVTDDPGGATRAARHGGLDALAALRLRPLRFVQPMLAATAGPLEAALDDMGEVVVDVKLDGARVQVHRVDSDVRVFTRNGNDVTARLPEVVEAVRQVDADAVVLDGEVLRVDADGTPLPFGDTMARFGTEAVDEDGDEEGHDGTGHDGPGQDDEGRLAVFFFDVLLALGGATPAHEGDAIDLPLEQRLTVLDAVVPDELRVQRLRSADNDAVRAFATDAIERRLEGVMLKDPTALYAAGRRGKAWRKAKPVHTLDLVVLAVEWGSGRRRGWLSNLHLGARSDDGFVMLGKTFKGLTDQMLQWQTERLLGLEVRRDRHVVHVRPELVVEVALDGFVRSPRYPAGIALRFARVKHHRPDKAAEDADTVATALAIHTGEVRPTLP